MGGEEGEEESDGVVRTVDGAGGLFGTEGDGRSYILA